MSKRRRGFRGQNNKSWEASLTDVNVSRIFIGDVSHFERAQPLQRHISRRKDRGRRLFQIEDVAQVIDIEIRMTSER